MNTVLTVLPVVVLVAMIVHAIRILRYARSDDWQIDQRLTCYAGR